MDDFTTALIDAMAAPPHVCDKLCETGEPVAEWEQINPDGSRTRVYGPESERPDVSPVHVDTSAVRYTDGSPVPPDVFLSPGGNMFLPRKVGRKRQAEIQAQAEADNPDAEVTVDCEGGVLIIPKDLLAQRDQGQ